MDRAVALQQSLAAVHLGFVVVLREFCVGSWEEDHEHSLGNAVPETYSEEWIKGTTWAVQRTIVGMSIASLETRFD
jgi:broad specificity phosphatase PhoE